MWSFFFFNREKDWNDYFYFYLLKHIDVHTRLKRFTIHDVCTKLLDDNMLKGDDFILWHALYIIYKWHFAIIIFQICFFILFEFTITSLVN